MTMQLKITLADKVLETDTYKLFELLDFNRDVKNTEALTQSMKKYGWISAYPINVVKSGNGKLRIKDGHHRFEVAQKLGIPIKYVICDDDSTIYELDRATNKWSMNDSLSSYVRAGKIEYAKVKEYCDKTGIAPGNAASMLYGQIAGSGNVNETFSDGLFKCRNTRNAEIVASLVLTMKKLGIKWAASGWVVIALSKISFVENFSVQRMKTKLTAYAHLIEKRPNVESYLDLFEMIYNYKSQDKVPLKFMAAQAAKERNPIALRKEQKELSHARSQH